MARGSGTRKGWGINMTKEDTDKEDDGGTGGDDAPGGDQAESGGTVGAADSHISDADSGTAGIADEMYRRLEALITEIMVKAAQQAQQNPQETQFPKED